MLGLFVSESRKDIDRLSAAVKEKDSREIISILHRNLPLWETVRLDYPVAVLHSQNRHRIVQTYRLPQRQVPVEDGNDFPAVLFFHGG